MALHTQSQHVKLGPFRTRGVASAPPRKEGTEEVFAWYVGHG
jgi:hypothetical protein